MEKEHKMSALMCKTKEQLAELIMTLEYNNNVLHETLDTQAANYIKMTSWIPVSERMPDRDSYVMVSFDDGFIATVNYGDDFELWCDSGDPVAWMRLHEPYKPD